MIMAIKSGSWMTVKVYEIPTILVKFILSKLFLINLNFLLDFVFLIYHNALKKAVKIMNTNTINILLVLISVEVLIGTSGRRGS